MLSTTYIIYIIYIYKYRLKSHSSIRQTILQHMYVFLKREILTSYDTPPNNNPIIFIKNWDWK